MNTAAFALTVVIVTSGQSNLT